MFLISWDLVISALTLTLFPHPFLMQPQSYDAVEPLDLEEFLTSQLRSGETTMMQELGDFPDDDLKVEQVEKECRTVRHSVPEDGWVTGCLTLVHDAKLHRLHSKLRLSKTFPISYGKSILLLMWTGDRLRSIRVLELPQHCFTKIF